MPHSPESKGAGWGGPAKGAGNKGPGPGRPKKDVSALKAAAREQRIAALKDHLLDLALTAEREETQLSATVAYLNREEGTPVQRSEVKLRTVNPDDLTDEELASIAARGSRATAGAEENPG